MMSIVVNLFAGPGAGKSTVMAGMFYKLKQAGVLTEMVRDFAKDLVWQKSTNLLTNQLYVVAEQYKRIRVLVEAEVDVIVCDSPLLLGLIYDPDQSISLSQLFVSKHEEFNNVNYFVERIKAFEPRGRIHTEKQSLIKDKEILDMLCADDIPFTRITTSEKAITGATNDILKLLGKNDR